MVSYPIFRMRCADISAEDTPDGNWVKAEAMFSGAVTGTVMLVRKKSKFNISVLHIFTCAASLFNTLVMRVGSSGWLPGSKVLLQVLNCLF